ncbi:MAG: ABC transporter permease [Candidatus Diapherotrites archaeon]|uniref:ABC transporter permease n=1 Tax=Candidatus Iainarchaeum sp. TaxID=3101447 RepID=A0A8T3YJS5_9ARCH|nr:ABC transporter permease [Candidatus Diapherotrites archaeon]
MNEQPLAEAARQSLERAYSQFYKNVRLITQNHFRLMDTTIWPLTLLLAFAFLAQALNNDPAVIALVVLGMMGWQVVQQTQMGMATCYMDEFWSNSLTHLFVTPIRLGEFLLGGIMTGLLKCAIVLMLFFAAAAVFYGIHIPDPAAFIAALFFLLLFGISLGMINLAIIFPRGENAIFTVWTLPDILVVLSGVYYPLEILPGPLNWAAQLLPSSHAFNLIKETLGMATTDWAALIGLSAVWLIGSWLLLQNSFRYAKMTGKLVRVA